MLLIMDFEITEWNELGNTVVLTIGISQICKETLELPSKASLRICLKLSSPEQMIDSRCGRSTPTIF